MNPFAPLNIDDFEHFIKYSLLLVVVGVVVLLLLSEQAICYGRFEAAHFI